MKLRVEGSSNSIRSFSSSFLRRSDFRTHTCRSDSSSPGLRPPEVTGENARRFDPSRSSIRTANRNPLGFTRDHLCLARNQTGRCTRERASSSNGWRLTNLIFRGTPPRGRQHRVSTDPSAVAATPSPVGRARARARFLFLFAVVSCAICAPLFSRSRLFTAAAAPLDPIGSLVFATDAIVSLLRGQCLLRKSVSLCISPPPFLSLFPLSCHLRSRSTTSTPVHVNRDFSSTRVFYPWVAIKNIKK